MLKLVAWLVVLAAVGWGLFVFARDEDNANANALRSSAGFVDSGGKFGVRVSDPLGTADQALRRHHFSLRQREDLQTCLSHRYPLTQAVALYKDHTWRKGTACLAYDRDSRRIRSIEWSYGPFNVDL
jgi:hypothetical protein